MYISFWYIVYTLYTYMYIQTGCSNNNHLKMPWSSTLQADQGIQLGGVAPERRISRAGVLIHHGQTCFPTLALKKLVPAKSSPRLTRWQLEGDAKVANTLRDYL